MKLWAVSGGRCELCNRLLYSDQHFGIDGNFEIVKWANGEALLNQRVCKIIPKSIKPDYLFYLLSPILKSIENKTHSTTVKHLSAKELNKISFELPNGDQQSKIANELSDLHRMLTLKREALEGLDSLVKSRFSGEASYVA